LPSREKLTRFLCVVFPNLADIFLTVCLYSVVGHLSSLNLSKLDIQRLRKHYF
jgi:hypothetical protein